MTRRLLPALLLVAALAYLGLGAGLYLAQRSILFRPDTTRPDIAAVGVPALQAITLPPGLLAWYLPPQPEQPTVLYFHGNGGNLADRARRIRDVAALGFGLLMPEYPGYGGNPGTPSQTALFATATVSLEHLTQAGIPDASIILYGESLGTAVAAFLATGRPFRALILESPFTSVIALAEQRYWFLPVKFLVRDPFDTLARIARIRSPLLVAQGGRDDIVPPRMGREILAAAPEPKQLWLAPDGNHEDLAQFGLIAAVTTFLMTHTGNSSTLGTHGAP